MGKSDDSACGLTLPSWSPAYTRILRSGIHSQPNKPVAYSAQGLHISRGRLTSRYDFNHLFLEQLLSGNSRMPNAGDDRGGISKARQAAEELFKPKREPASDASASTPDTVLPDGDFPRRQPRIFTVPSSMPANVAKAETTTEPQPKRRKAAPKRQTRDIPASQFGRVRALTNYGMTRAEVAHLYGVTVDDIERIIKGAQKSRRPSP
jgi:hypothetical protein